MTITWYCFCVPKNTSLCEYCKWSQSYSKRHCGLFASSDFFICKNRNKGWRYTCQALVEFSWMRIDYKLIWRSTQGANLFTPWTLKYQWSWGYFDYKVIISSWTLTLWLFNGKNLALLSLILWMIRWISTLFAKSRQIFR